MIDLRPACDGMIGVLAGIGGADLAAPTPCTEYSVGDLIAHVGEAAGGFAALARRARGSAAAADAVPAAPAGAEEWRVRVPARVRELGDAWAAPAAWTGVSEAAGVELPNEQWGGIALTEMVVHGWDLARATGQDLRIPEGTLRACLAHVTAFVPVAPLPQLWGTPALLSEEAPLLDRVVAATGRRP